MARQEESTLSFQEQFLGKCPLVNPEAHPLDGNDVHLVHRTTEDVLEQADALPFWRQDYTQLDKGSFCGSVDSVTYQGIQLFSETMNRAVDTIAMAPVNSMVIGLPTVIEGDATWGLLPVKVNSLITLDKNAELVFRTSHLSEIKMAVIPAQKLEDYAAQVECVDLQKMMEKVKPVDTVTAQTTAHLLTMLTDGMHYMSALNDSENAHQVWLNFERDLIATSVQMLLQASNSQGHHYDHRIHRYIVNRVRDLTLSSSGYPLSIEELCISLRISRRTLNHAFLRVLGITPVAYMRNVRLHRIRAELQSTPHLVRYIASVAAKWGFWHMSLFSRYYRELFGETPLETLIRARVGNRQQ